MKNQIKLVLNNKWFIPLLLLNYGVFNILFGEVYPVNEGFGTDGFVYRTLVESFNHSRYYDAFFIHRIFPSALIRLILSAFSFDFSAKNIFYAFEILNVLSVVVSSYFIKLILIHLNVGFQKQMLAFVLIFCSFALIKWPYYFPVMTDTIAFGLSTLLLYFYIKDRPAGVLIITLLLAFTWPMGYYQGLLLLAFPYKRIEYTDHPRKWTIFIQVMSVLLFLTVFSIVILIKNVDTNIIFIPKIDRSLLIITMIFSAILFRAFSFLFMNSKLFIISEFLRSLKSVRLLLTILVFSGVYFFIHQLQLPPSSVYKVSAILENPVVHSSVRPLLTYVAHFTFYGIAFCMLLIFWKKVTVTISECGWGLVGAVALNLFLFGIMPESRMLINLFPWLIIFLAVALERYSFPKGFYALVVILSLASSRIWLLIDYEMDPALGMRVDENGSIDFPNQRFYMNMGPWMSENAYYIMGCAMVLSLVTLFFLLFKIEKNTAGRFVLIARFRKSQATQ